MKLETLSSMGKRCGCMGSNDCTFEKDLNDLIIQVYNLLSAMKIVIGGYMD